MSRPRLVAIYTCFLISGLSALIYEVVWQRMLTLVFGVSTWSVAAVLTSFMGGLALGAWGAGRIADRFGNAARAYGMVELGIALTGLVVSWAIDPFMGFYVRVAHALDPGFYTSNLIRFGLALAVFIVPSALIGATMPLMARLITPAAGSIGVGFGRFYAVNTAGAVMGAGLAGFWFIPTIGMHAAVWVAICGNVVAAIIALATARSREAFTPALSDTANDDRAGYGGAARRADPVLVIAAAAGLTALGYEVAWTRLLAIYTLNSVYVFTMILTVYLAGLAVGGALAAWILRWFRPDPWAVIAWVQMLLALSCPTVLALTRVATEYGYEYQYRSAGYVLFLEYIEVAVVVLVPTILLGLTLPLLVALHRGGAGSPGRTVGTVYAANSVGTIVGAAMTGIVLIPWWGLRTTLMAFALGNFCIGVYAAYARGTLSPSWRSLVPAASILLVAISLLTPHGTEFIRPASADDSALLYYAEGNSAVVHIEQTESRGRHDRVLYVDSQSVAGTSEEIVTDQKMLAHLPLLLHNDPRRVLTVGFGTGGTSYSMLLHGVVTHCVEIERAVPAAARFFVNQNGGVVGLSQGLESGRRDFRLILDDARSWLYVGREPYDVIVNDLTSIQYRGNGNLFTKECFELIRQRLRPGGIGCAWLPITGVAPEPLKVAIRSFRAAFDHTSVWYMNNLVNDFVILVGTPEELVIDLAAWEWRMKDPHVAADLTAVGLRDPLKLANCLLLSEDDLDCYLGEGDIHTDDRPILDYLTHAGVYRDTLSENLGAMLACSGDPQAFVSTPPESIPAEDFDVHWTRWQAATRHLLEGHALARDGNGPAAADRYREAANLVPGDPGIRKLIGLPPVRSAEPPG